MMLSSRLPYLKYLAVLLTVVTIYVLTHHSTTITSSLPTQQQQQQQQQPSQAQPPQVENVKVPEELKTEPEQKDQKNEEVKAEVEQESTSKAVKPKESTPEEKPKRIKATFVTLARNEELYDLIKSIRTVEDRFNRKFNYDWVFLNDKEFTQEFKDLTSSIVSGKTKYGKIPTEHWSYPDFIDLKKAEETRKNMKLAKIIYGDSESYRHMCRFESGFFWRNELLDEYDWYWRVEPGIDIHCDLDYDLFKYMEDNNKVYGFTISIHEFRKTIETLWDHTKKFIKENPQYIAKDNFMDFISDDNGETYNLCHFWSNFEIANLNFWRGEAYTKYFEYLDKTGGFFYERWGDAPIHSIAVALFLNKQDIHWFENVGYYHAPYLQCPQDTTLYVDSKCTCDPDNDFTWTDLSCTSHFLKVIASSPEIL